MSRFISKGIIFIGTVLGLILASDLSAASLPSELIVDYTPYNPLSLVLKKFNWLEDEFKSSHVRIRRVFCLGSDSALNYLQADSVNIASSASIASVCRRAEGKRIKAVYVFTRAEWVSIIVSRDSPINSVKELKGKRIAATPGTDPYFFLLRSLREAGLHKNDVVIVPMSHTEGRMAVEQNKVDAWAAGTPHSAMSQMESGTRVLYRNVLFNSYGFLNVSEDFDRKYPQAVSRVIKVYEKARKWALKHPDDLEAIYADEGKVPLPITRMLMSRNDFSNPVVGRNDVRLMKEAYPVLKEENLVPPNVDADKVIADLIDTSFLVKQVVQGHDK
jgi:sulfonate transport system substrate-binding protein